MIHTVKGFGIVNKAEVSVFLELSCFFHDPADVGNLISSSSAFSKTSLNTWKFMVHVLLKPGLENFEHYFPSVWDECNCAVVWAFFGIAFLWNWNKNWPFPVLWPLLSFPNLLAYWVQHFHSIIFQDLKQLHWNSITSTSFVRMENSSAACKRIQPDYFLTLYTKINSKWIKDLDVNLKLKLLDENVGRTFLLRKRKHLR